MAKTKQSISIKLCVKLGKSTTETTEMLHGTFGEHSLSRTAVFNDIHVSRTVRLQLKMMNVRGEQALTKLQKMLKSTYRSSLFINEREEDPKT
jgi:hypothetical protein